MNYCHLAAVSTDAPEVAAAFRAGLGADFPFLSDHERSAIRELEIVDETDPTHGLIAIPYTFVLGGDLTLSRIYDGWWYLGRPTVEELRQDLRTLMACRRDWTYQPPGGPRP